MTGLGLVRTFSHGVVRLAWRHGSGGLATDGWQDKSAAFRPGASGWLDKEILPARRTPLPVPPFTMPTISASSAPSPNLRSREQP